MLYTNENTQTQNTASNILLSLEYLKEEAKRENNFELYEVIEIACILGREIEPIDVYENKSLKVNKDSIRAATFLLKFIQASTESKKEFLEILEYKEI